MKRRVKYIHCRNRHGAEYNSAPVEHLRKHLPIENTGHRTEKKTRDMPGNASTNQ